MLYSDIIIENIPDGTYEVIWYNNIHHYQHRPSEHYVTLVIRNVETDEHKYIEVNTKESPAIPLGLIFKDKKITKKRTGKVFTSVINIPTHNEYTKTRSLSEDVYKEEPYFELVDDIKIAGTNMKYMLMSRSKEQRVLEYEDILGNKIIFPSYVIAQYYYFRSSSMTKQVLASYIGNITALKGLYKEIDIDKESGHASIVLKPNAKSRDGAEIFRFAIHKYANMMFHRVFKDLLKSREEIKAKFEYKNIDLKHNISTLSVFFPFHGISYFKYRGVKLSDGSILALEILEEDSSYPFESLTVYRQAKSLVNRQVQLGKVFNTLSTNIKEYMRDNVPNSSFEPVSVYTEQKLDGRLDLEDKEIDYELLEIDELGEAHNEVVDIDYETDMSSSESESDGDLGSTQAHLEQNLVEKPKGWDEIERAGLEAFLLMLETAQEIALNDGKTFSYVVDDEFMLPQKPEHSKDRKKWLKGLMINNKTPRAYSCAHIECNGKNLCVFDVERDKRVEGLSLLVIRMENNMPVSQDIINDILVDFVKEKGSWLQNVDTKKFKYKNFNHPKVITDDSIEEWAKRLLNSINKL